MQSDLLIPFGQNAVDTRGVEGVFHVGENLKTVKSYSKEFSILATTLNKKIILFYAHFLIKSFILYKLV